MGTLISRIKRFFTRDKEPIELLLEQMEKERAHQEKPECNLACCASSRKPIYRRKAIKNYRYYTDGTLFDEPTESLDTDLKYSLSEIR